MKERRVRGRWMLESIFLVLESISTDLVPGDVEQALVLKTRPQKRELVVSEY